MRIGKIVKIVAIGLPVLVVGLVVVALVVLMNTDFNRYKPLIAEETKKATGRDLVIAGNLELDISLTPSVVVEGVTLSNAKWGARPEMVKVDRFEARISLAPLIFGVIDVSRVVLIGADILLEVDKKGRANFALAPPGAAAEAGKKKDKDKAAAPAPGDADGKAAIPVIREVVIRDSRLIYTDARTGAKYDVGIETLTISGDGPSEPIELLYEGSYNKAEIEFSALLGAPIELIAPSQPWPVDLRLEAGGATITVQGTIAEPAAGKGLKLAVAVSGDELGGLSALTGSDVPKVGAYSLSATVTGNPASTVKLAGLKAAIAGSDLSGDVTVKLSGKRPAIVATLKSNKIDLSAFGAAGGGGGGGGAGTGGGDQAKKKSNKVFPKDPLPLEGLRAVDVKLKFDAGTIVLAGAKLLNANIGLSLKGGKLVIKPLKATIADGAINGSITLDGRKKAAGLVVKTTLQKVDLDKLLTDLKITEDVEGKANINIDVSGRGSSVAGIMATLNGRVGLLMGKGRMKDTFLQSLLGGGGMLLNRILDQGQKGYTAVECAVVDFTIKKGVATAKALYLDLDSRGVIGSGTANLRKETLNLTVDPRAKRNMSKSVLPVRIKGTFANPKYKIDEKAAAGKIGKLLGFELPAALTGGKAGADTAVIEGDCAPPAPPRKAQPATQQQQQAQPAPTDPKKKALEDAEEKLKEGLKGLFGN